MRFKTVDFRKTRTMKYLLIFLALPLFSCKAVSRPEKIVIQSPDHHLVMSVYLKKDQHQNNHLFYDVSYMGKPVVLSSEMGLSVAHTSYWKENYRVTGVERLQKDTSWKPVYGDKSVIRNHYNEAIIHLEKIRYPSRKMDLIVRAYDSGVAFQYAFPESANGKSLFVITADQTEFTMPEGTKAWVTYKPQGYYKLLPLSGWKKSACRPLTMELKNGLYVSLSEARMIDFARAQFALDTTKTNTIECSLAGDVHKYLPFSTPWRVVMVAQKPGDLLTDDDLILNLNPKNEIEDTSWIKPGKMMREVTLSAAGAKNVIDFDAKHNIKYMLFDAGWYGNEWGMGDNATKVNPKHDLNMPGIVKYAKEHGVGVFLYVNQIALTYQIDQILPLYHKWGISGVKFGFVHVGPQLWSTWLHNAVKKAAKYHLMVDIHDKFRLTGFSRTYPNLMVTEGVGGNEIFPDATHNTVLPFTRYVTGPADYTICYYDKRLKTTHAHQLALSVVYYDPIQVIFWYDKPSEYHGEPEIAFFDHVPTTWDDTKVLDGAIGQYITVARRSGNQWFIGSITNDNGRDLNVPLDFLQKGKKYVAHIYSDGGQEIKTRTHVKAQQFIVDSSTKLKLDLKPSGGCAIRLVPATTHDVSTLQKYK